MNIPHEFLLLQGTRRTVHGRRGWWAISKGEILGLAQSLPSA